MLKVMMVRVLFVGATCRERVLRGLEPPPPGHAQPRRDKPHLPRAPQLPHRPRSGLNERGVLPHRFGRTPQPLNLYEPRARWRWEGG
jgi:hypothetical protein